MSNDTKHGLFGGAPIIVSYSRAEAIADGVLFDAGDMAREAGWKIPVALSSAVWADCVAWGELDTARKRCPQDESGRLWDVLWMSMVAARQQMARCRAHPDLDSGRCQMIVYRVPRHGSSIEPERVELKIIIAGGDDGQPVATILEPRED